VQFPAEQDAARLYRLHRGMVWRSATCDQVFRIDEDFKGNAAAAVASCTAVALEAQVAAGYTYLDTDEQVYRHNRSTSRRSTCVALCAPDAGGPPKERAKQAIREQCRSNCGPPDAATRRRWRLDGPLGNPSGRSFLGVGLPSCELVSPRPAATMEPVAGLPQGGNSWPSAFDR
jgi:hypothetical protein